MEDNVLKERIGAVILRWEKARLLRFNSHDDGSDDLLLRDEIYRALAPEVERCEDCGGLRSEPGAPAICAGWHRPLAPEGPPRRDGLLRALAMPVR